MSETHAQGCFLTVITEYVLECEYKG